MPENMSEILKPEELTSEHTKTPIESRLESSPQELKMSVEDKAKEEEEYRNSQEGYRKGYAFTETIMASENPIAIGRATMEFMKAYGNQEYSNQNYRSPYDLGRIVAEVQSRQRALSIPLEDLKNPNTWNVITKINEDNTGEVNVPGYALGERNKKVKKDVGEITDKDGNTISKESRIFEVTIPYIGTEAERNSASEALGDSHAEIVVTGVNYQNHKHHEENSENIGERGLSEDYLHDMLTGKAMERFFNLPLLSEKGWKTEGGTEIKTRGQMIHLSERLLEVIGLAERPDELNFYRSRPGWQELFPGSTPDKPTDAEIKWIGNVNKWTRGYTNENGKLKEIKKGENKKGFRIKDDVEKERKAEDRGPITDLGNIIANASAKSMLKIRGEFRRFLGARDNSPDHIKSSVEWAEDQAFKLARPWGVVDKNGWEIYLNEKDPSKYKLEMAMGPGWGSDWLKVMKEALYEWKNVQGRRRDAGPIYTRGKIESLMTSLPETLAFKVGVSYNDAEPVNEKRTIKELTWGYEDESYFFLDEKDKPIRKGDDDKGKKYFNYEEIPWEKEFGRYPEKLFFLRPFMIARVQSIYDMKRKGNWSARDVAEMVHHDFPEQMMKKLEVGIPDSVYFRGKYKGKYETRDGERKIKKEFKDGHYNYHSKIVSTIWDGVRSSKLYRNILTEGIKVAIAGSILDINMSTVEEIQNVWKQVLDIKIDTAEISLKDRQKLVNFWEEKIEDNYLYPPPETLEVRK